MINCAFPLKHVCLGSYAKVIYLEIISDWQQVQTGGLI